MLLQTGTGQHKGSSLLGSLTAAAQPQRAGGLESSGIILLPFS